MLEKQEIGLKMNLIIRVDFNKDNMYNDKIFPAFANTV